MKALIISDGEFKTSQFDELAGLLDGYLKDKGFDIEHIAVGRDDLAFCMGCFGCWVKKPGECVIDDLMSRINRTYVACDAVFYLCPVVFGQFSANIKTVLDRWLPNMLPFFYAREDGSTMHPPRYASYPRHVMIGYGDMLLQEDARLFCDIIKKHRPNVEVLIYRAGAGIIISLDGISLKRTDGLF